MTATCLTCSANKYLMMITEKEWRILQYLLPPYGMKRLANLDCIYVPICVKCQTKLHSIDNFRTSAFRNIFRFMRIMEEKQLNNSSTSTYTHIAKTTSSPQVKTVESSTEASFLASQQNVVIKKEQNSLLIEEDFVIDMEENPFHIEESVIKMETNYDDDDDIEKKTVIEENSVIVNEVNTLQSEEFIVKLEPNYDDDIGAQKEQSKIMLHNVLQSMYVKKAEVAAPSPSSSSITSHPLPKLNLMLENCDQITQQSATNPVRNTQLLRELYPVLNVPKLPLPIEFVCDYCGNTFVNKNYLGTHIRTVHLNIRCSQCAKAYPRPSQLQEHVARTHEASKRPRDYVCHTCGAAFLTKNMLTAHMVIHTGERPYACGKCGATFGYKAALYTHNKLKHSKKQEDKSEKQEDKSDKQQDNSEKQEDKSEKQEDNSEKQEYNSNKQEYKSEKQKDNSEKQEDKSEKQEDNTEKQEDNSEKQEKKIKKREKIKKNKQKDKKCEREKDIKRTIDIL